MSIVTVNVSNVKSLGLGFLLGFWVSFQCPLESLGNIGGKVVF